MTCTERESNGGGRLAMEREVAHYLATGESFRAGATRLHGGDDGRMNARSSGETTDR
jgi:hypothetical protein